MNSIYHLKIDPDLPNTRKGPIQVTDIFRQRVQAVNIQAKDLKTENAHI